jgi:hypothetical protein
MRQVVVPLPELAAIAATRVVGGAGAALLLSHRIRPRQRRRIGWVLLAIGLASTVPLVLDVIRRNADFDRERPKSDNSESAH